jgi:hypothetical protein
MEMTVEKHGNEVWEIPNQLAAEKLRDAIKAQRIRINAATAKGNIRILNDANRGMNRLALLRYAERLNGAKAAVGDPHRSIVYRVTKPKESSQQGK